MFKSSLKFIFSKRILQSWTRIHSDLIAALWRNGSAQFKSYSYSLYYLPDHEAHGPIAVVQERRRRATVLNDGVAELYLAVRVVCIVLFPLDV